MATAIRNAQIAAIHVRKKQLRLSDELYRSIIARLSGGKTSSAQLDASQRARLLDELERLGAPNTRPPAPAPGEPQIAKIKRLWLELDRVHALQDSSDQALRAFVKRVAHRDALEWLTPDDANKVIEGLKAWLARVTTRA
jgi:phage gp16-like protein